MSTIIDLEIIGDYVGLNEMLARVVDSLSLQSMLTFQSVQVETILEGRAKARFANEGDDAVGGWAPLMDSTLAIRQSQGYGSGPINHRTGLLEDYITGGSFSLIASGGDTELTYPRPTGDASLVAKVTTAQKGKSWPPTVPRPVLGVSEVDVQMVLVELSEHILMGMAAVP